MLNLFSSPEIFVLLAPLTAILVIACITDLTQRKISNKLTLFAVLLGMFNHSIMFGTDGLWFAFCGCLVTVGLTLPLYFTRGISAGDIKLLAGVGAFVGAQTGLWVVLFTLAAGFPLALYALWRQKQQVPELAIPLHVHTGKFAYSPAITFGTLFGIYWNYPNFIAQVLN